MQAALCHTAFDAGITQFDLANNYGPPYGMAETNAGRILKEDFLSYRDELVIAQKAGYDMWEGPYGNWGSKKYLTASLDQSLKRLGLEYVDIFYHQRMDPATPLEETMEALTQIVRSGKALYAGISNYDKIYTEKAVAVMSKLRCPLIVNQRRYSIFDRTIEEGVKRFGRQAGMGIIAFSPLAQGLLTDKFLRGIPEDGRIAGDIRYIDRNALSLLKQSGWLRCHKSYVVNIYQIKEIYPRFNSTFNVRTRGCEEEIPISRTYVKVVKGALGM